ncbi:GNAT family N-acetyltransferase [Streptomyces sp. NBC_01476]|uniref:GNAT family N-acetyltransferase n=1 Tax=Streptomyces sp. NBC_01476 TaxID=2903881 RepID=UPI002E319AF0|nr:GNAT family N-acetyltransferase [Streptomyces sp. NBC_01476]
MAEVHAIRHEVFVVEQDVPPDLEWDGKDDRAVHALAEGAGTGRLLLGEDAAGKNGGDPRLAVLGRLAVLKAARGGGVGARLVRALEEEAGRLGLAGIYLEAQVHALPFYERLGYTAYGPEFMDAGIVHRAMRREFSRGPADGPQPRSGTNRDSEATAATK